MGSCLMKHLAALKLPLALTQIQKKKRASSAITFTVSNKRYTCNDSLLRKIYT